MNSGSDWRDQRDRIVAWQKSTANGANPTEDGRGNRYYYDEEGQLTDAYYGALDPAGNPNSWQREDHFNLDALGNRRGWDYVQTKGWQNFTRKDNGLNQYRAWWNYSIINYDDDIGGTWGSPGHANGVIMQDGWVTAGYNALNQPMYIWSGNVGWTYFGYDPLGRCVKRWADNGSVSFMYYDGWNLIQEGPQSNVADRQYVNGARTDEVVAQITPSNNWIRYFHYDANGNCTLQTDGWGNIAEQYDYDAFGFPYFYDAWGNNIGYSPWGNRMLFTGREWLKDLKLYDYRARLYNPELGRFMQPDPKEFAAGDYNLYRYCHNEPVNRSDPTGEGGLPDFAGLGRQIIGVVSDFIRDTREGLANDPDRYVLAAADTIAQLNKMDPEGRRMAALSRSLGPRGGLRNVADQKRVADQRAARAVRRENKSRDVAGQNRTGEGFRDHESANKDPRGERPSGPSTRDGRERNVGIDEEHSRVPKGLHRPGD